MVQDFVPMNDHQKRKTKMNNMVEKLNAAAVKIVNNGIKAFREHIGNSVKEILLAAQQYAEHIENYPKIAPKMYREAFPNVTERSWELMRKIGCGDLVPTAFFQEKDSLINMAAKTPYKLQQVILGDEEHKAVPQNLWDGKKVVQKLYSDMSPAEAMRLLDTVNGKVRTIEEQKKFSPVKVVSNTVVAVAEAPYVIIGKCVIFKKHCEIGASELRAIAKKLGLKVS